MKFRITIESEKENIPYIRHPLHQRILKFLENNFGAKTLCSKKNVKSYTDFIPNSKSIAIVEIDECAI